MTRLPKKRGITQVEGDKSLILRQFEADIRLRASGIKLNIGFNFKLALPEVSFSQGLQNSVSKAIKMLKK